MPAHEGDALAVRRECRLILPASASDRTASAPRSAGPWIHSWFSEPNTSVEPSGLICSVADVPHDDSASSSNGIVVLDARGPSSCSTWALKLISRTAPVRDLDLVEGPVLHEHHRCSVGRERESRAPVQVLSVDREGEPVILVRDEVPEPEARLVASTSAT